MRILKLYINYYLQHFEEINKHLKITEDNTEPIIVPATPSTAVVIATNAEMKATKIIFE